MREIRMLCLTRRELETWPRSNCDPTTQSKECGWKPSTYRARASSRPYQLSSGAGDFDLVLGTGKIARVQADFIFDSFGNIVSSLMGHYTEFSMRSRMEQSSDRRTAFEAEVTERFGILPNFFRSGQRRTDGPLLDDAPPRDRD